MPTREKSDREACLSQSGGRSPEEERVNRIIYIVGLVVVVVAILSFFGLR
jgi:hypothetical protein